MATVRKDGVTIEIKDKDLKVYQDRGYTQITEAYLKVIEELGKLDSKQLKAEAKKVGIDVKEDTPPALIIQKLAQIRNISKGL